MGVVLPHQPSVVRESTGRPALRPGRPFPIFTGGGMLVQYRNIGGPWRRSSGEVVEHNEVFTPTKFELARMVHRRQIGIRFEAVAPRDVFEEQVEDGKTVTLPDTEENSWSTAEEEEEDESASTEDSEPQWPLRMSPKQYLNRHPRGQHAQLAREIARRR